jgi:hypothetical protein
MFVPKEKRVIIAQTLASLGRLSEPHEGKKLSGIAVRGKVQ